MTIDIYYICCANIYMCVCLVVYSLHGHEHVQKEGRIPLLLAPYCTNCQRLRVSLSVCVQLCVVFARCGPSLLLYKHEARLDTNYTTAFKVGVVARSLALAICAPCRGGCCSFSCSCPCCCYYVSISYKREASSGGSKCNNRKSFSPHLLLFLLPLRQQVK